MRFSGDAPDFVHERDLRARGLTSANRGCGLAAVRGAWLNIAGGRSTSSSRGAARAITVRPPAGGFGAFCDSLRLTSARWRFVSAWLGSMSSAF